MGCAACEKQAASLQGAPGKRVHGGGGGGGGGALVRVRETRVCRWFVNEAGAPERGARGAGKRAVEKGYVGKRKSSSMNGQTSQSLSKQRVNPPAALTCAADPHRGPVWDLGAQSEGVGETAGRSWRVRKPDSPPPAVLGSASHPVRAPEPQLPCFTAGTSRSLGALAS